ncbi:hypothetical protein [Kitasatospora sp. SolWspMP-SS2h]|uniref:hypothetical protein n=1 Tax=Kitasatospora sp. SolWspMP-SS2h TaxID=1305729 RepID=UPI0011B93FDC|nr:hypothetical protein [Kitasatospora sp. SolWspMP-SS2h]
MYIWDHEAQSDLPFVLACLDLPADTDPDAAAAAPVATVMSDSSDPARWPKTPSPFPQGTASDPGWDNPGTTVSQERPSMPVMSVFPGAVPGYFLR